MRNTQIAQEMLIVERFKKTVPSFQDKIKALAEANNKAVMQVYIWWREYCETCTNYDQSPVFSEFESWYKGKLEA